MEGTNDITNSAANNKKILLSNGNKDGLLITMYEYTAADGANKYVLIDLRFPSSTYYSGINFLMMDFIKCVSNLMLGKSFIHGKSNKNIIYDQKEEYGFLFSVDLKSKKISGIQIERDEKKEINKFRKALIAYENMKFLRSYYNILIFDNHVSVLNLSTLVLLPFISL